MSVLTANFAGELRVECEKRERECEGELRASFPRHQVGKRCRDSLSHRIASMCAGSESRAIDATVKEMEQQVSP